MSCNHDLAFGQQDLKSTKEALGVSLCCLPNPCGSNDEYKDEKQDNVNATRECKAEHRDI